MFKLLNKYKIQNFAGFFILAIMIFGNVQAKFADVDVTHPYYHSISYLQDTGVVEGYLENDGQRSFRPLQAVVRAEAIKILILASGIDVPESREKIFEDVNEGDWFFHYVNKAAKDKIVKGFTDGKFHPSAQVTRAEMLKMALLSFGLSEDDFVPTDNEKWFEPYFLFARKLRIISGEDEPYKSINRGEVAEIIYRTQKVAESGFTKKYTYSGSGKASFYNEGFVGNPTANGEVYDPMDLTAAHRALPFGTRLKVSYKDKFVIVRVNDRGPYHEDRIIDLSEKAFSLLAPTSKGVINVDFEVYTNPDDVKPEIPDFIKEKLSEKAQNPVVPDEVEEVVSKLRGISERSNKKKLTSSVKPIFPNETITLLQKDFFPNVELRSYFPRKYLKGSVINFSGRSLENGHKKITVFLQEILEGNKKDEEQILYTGDVSGKNFSFPVVLDKAGKFFLGVVLDDEKKSRTEIIEVVDQKDYRKFAGSETVFVNDFGVRVLPEESKIFFDFTGNESTDLQKIVFSQSGLKQKILYVYGGIDTLELSYDFFAGFEEFRNLAVDLFVAESLDGTLDTQISAWKKSAFKNFEIAKSFPDTEDDRLNLKEFVRYYKKLEPVSFVGKILSPDLNIKKEVYITSPTGRIQTNKINELNNEIYFEVDPTDWGRYVIEILSDEGEILFNRAIYFSRKIVIPIMQEEKISVRGETIPNVRFWINSVRKNAGKNALISDYALNKFAQNYAEQMVRENFISHITPTGMDFGDRIKQAGLKGEFGENLSFGTTLDLALQGLNDSASHYKNMVSIRWKKVGIGLKEGKNGWYVVNLFGR